VIHTSNQAGCPARLENAVTYPKSLRAIVGFWLA